MSWKISYSEKARQDLRRIYEYIAHELQTEYTARKQTGRIIAGINKLDHMPLRNPLYQDEPWHSLGMRWFPIDNYLIFYFSDEKSETISIARIMYKGRDISKQL